jgi:hypothetical protein
MWDYSKTKGEKSMRRIMILRVITIASFIALMAPTALAYGSRNCSYGGNSLQGTFGFTLTGSRTTGANPGPRAAVGQLTADGNGNLAGSETQSNNGIIVQGVTETGTYVVNSDCSGTATLTLKGTGVDTTTRTFHFQILNNSQEFIAIVTDQGFTETIDFKQSD